MKYTVLVVDDEKLVRWSVGQVLSDNNCEIELASSGEEAIEKAKQIKFDLIVTDLKMDGMNGVETVREIKKVLPKIKAIVITAYGTEKDAWEARNENIALWMAKPFQMKELVRYINDLLKSPETPEVPDNTPKESHSSTLLSLLALLFVIQFCFYAISSAQSTPESSLNYYARYMYSIKDAGTRYEKLNTPSTVYFNSTDKEIYVIDLGSNRILSYDTNGIVIHEWKSFGKIKYPGSVAQDQEGNIYVGDASKSVIAILNYFGDVKGYLELTKILNTGEKNKEIASFTNSGKEKKAKTSNASEIRIHKLLIDQQDRIYIGDNKNNRVYVVDILTGKLIREISAKTNPDITIKSLSDMALDDRGDLLVLDAARNQVLIISPEGELIRSFGKTGDGKFYLGLASSMAYDMNRKWIMVTDSSRQMVLVFDNDGECFFEFGGLGITNGLFYFPRGITVDSNQNIYVLEPSMNRIQVFQVLTQNSQKEEKKS